MGRILTASILMVAYLSVPAAFAEGNLAWQPKRLELSVDAPALAFSTMEYRLETGKYHTWATSHDGYGPDLLRNSGINQVVINNLEVHASGTVYGLEFDEGALSISFAPNRLGNFASFAPGYGERDPKGTFVVL